MSEEFSRLRVIDIISRDPVTVSHNATVDEIAKKMSENEVGCVIVMKDGNAVGIITKGDIIRRVVAKNIHPSEAKAEDIMSSPLQFVFYDTTLEDALKIMDENNISHLAVFKGNRLMGVVSATDIIHLTSPLIERLKIISRGGK